MHNLLAFVTKYNHWLIFLLLEVVSGVMLFKYNSYQGSVWISSANALVGKVYKWQADVEQFFSLTRRSEYLTRRNIFLEQEVSLLRKALTDAKADTTQFQKEEMARMQDYHLIEAKVVSNSVERMNNLMTIDKGTADGVETDMGVVCGTGLVGVVYLTGSHYAVVLPVLNRLSNISCTIRGCGYFGYLTWDGEDPMAAYVEDVPRHAKFNVGDWVESSGYSSIFPPGITVGKIVQIFDSADGLSYRLKVHLSTDFSCLRDVYVITDKNFAEQRRLLEAARDSLSLQRK